jgi:hypothetical protein
LGPNLKPFLPVKPVSVLPVHHQPLGLQEAMEKEIAIA